MYNLYINVHNLVHTLAGLYIICVHLSINIIYFSLLDILIKRKGILKQYSVHGKALTVSVPSPRNISSTETVLNIMVLNISST